MGCGGIGIRNVWKWDMIDVLCVIFGWMENIIVSKIYDVKWYYEVK